MQNTMAVYLQAPAPLDEYPVHENSLKLVIHNRVFSKLGSEVLLSIQILVFKWVRQWPCSPLLDSCFLMPVYMNTAQVKEAYEC